MGARFGLAAAALAASLPAAAGAQDQAWVTEVVIQRLDDIFVERPETARFEPHRTSAWWQRGRTRHLPDDLANRPLRHDSFVLLDVGSRGEATGCRPLRASAEARLDALACTILMRPGDFLAYLPVPEGGAPPARWAMGVRFETMDAATAAARQAADMRPFIAVDPEPRAPRRAAATPAVATPTVSTQPRRAIAGHLTAGQYADLPDQTVVNGDFVAELAVDRQGVPTACTVSRSSGNDAVDRRTCELLMRQARYSLRSDAAGNLIEDVVTQRVDVGWILGSPR